LSFIEEAARGLSQHLKEGATVILESTTYPGTTEELLTPILEKGSGLTAGSQFCVGYSPERIDPGNSTWNFQNTPKVVSGIDPRSLQQVDDFYSLLVDQTVPVSSLGVAELTKLLENTFRHVNIALINELSMFAHQLNVNVWEAIDAASSKPFGYMRFTPGPGVGGHCLPVDPSYLSWKVKQTLGDQFRFIDLANDVNEHMPEHVINRVTRILNEKQMAVSKSRILVLGLAYKKNSGDMRESPATAVCSGLERLGATVRVVDTWVPAYYDVPWERVELTDDEISAADLVVIVTDHDDVDYERVVKHAQLVFDTRRRTAAGPTVTHL
jgi:UDP-N-acetyl-D-glucosamine dehydrogenase